MAILLVEDDPHMYGFLQRGLRENAYTVDLATDGEAALEMAGTHPYDLVILDLMLPGTSGFTVCRRLRSSGSRVPILILTARDAIEDKIAGLDLGADDYLTKPFEFAELLARIRALLRRGSDAAAPVRQLADLVIDVRAKRVSRAGSAIALSSKEYSLLELLSRRIGHLVSRSEIISEVWDGDMDPDSNVIEVYINRLRRKIDHGYEPPLIHTRRGSGYVLDVIGSPATAKSQEQEA